MTEEFKRSVVDGLDLACVIDHDNAIRSDVEEATVTALAGLQVRLGSHAIADIADNADEGRLAIMLDWLRVNNYRHLCAILALKRVRRGIGCLVAEKAGYALGSPFSVLVNEKVGWAHPDSFLSLIAG